ncbi:MAG: putative sigma-54 modulation protein [Granulosicoccus sp.]|jgi:putative sigma-54 modulation protein
MTVKIQSIHFDADDKLLQFIEQRVEKLKSYNSEIIDAQVYLRLDKNDAMSNKIAEIKLIIPGNDLFSKKQCKSFEEAIDQAGEALRRQLKKRKEKAMP